MLQLFMFLIILSQHIEIFCGGKFSKTTSSLNSKKSYKIYNEYKEINQSPEDYILDSCIECDTPIFRNDETFNAQDYTITRQLTSCTVINKDNATESKVAWTTSCSIQNPTENQILEQCGRAMNIVSEIAMQQDSDSAKIAIIVEVDYNSKLK